MQFHFLLVAFYNCACLMENECHPRNSFVGFSLCNLVTPGLCKDIQCHV